MSQISFDTSAPIISLDNTTGGARKWGLQSANSGSFKIVDQTGSQDYLIIDSNGNFGLSGNAYADTKLKVEKTITSTSGTQYCAYGDLTLTPAAASGSDRRGGIR